MTKALLDRMLEPLRRRLQLLVSRAVVTLVKDALDLQGVQVALLANEVADVERFQQYGFTGVPSVGAEAIMVCVGGSRSHGIVIAVDDRRFRPKGLAEGETAQYSRFGQRITCKADGSIELKAAAGKPVTVPGNLEVAGDLEVTGDIAAEGNIDAAGNIAAQGNVSDAAGTMQEMRDVFNAHVHPENNGSGGPNTNPPITPMT